MPSACPSTGERAEVPAAVDVRLAAGFADAGEETACECPPLWRAALRGSGELGLPCRAQLGQVPVCLQLAGLWASLPWEGAVCWKLRNQCDRAVLAPSDAIAVATLQKANLSVHSACISGVLFFFFLKYLWGRMC